MLCALSGSMGSLKSSEVGSLGSFKRSCGFSTNSCSVSNSNEGEVDDHHLHHRSSNDQVKMDINGVLLRSISTKATNPRPPLNDSSTAASAFDGGLIPPPAPGVKIQDQEEEEENISQSPERSLWEFFADQLEGGDFMISSPIRNLPPVPPLHSHLSSSTFGNHNHGSNDGDGDGSNNCLINYDNGHDHPAPAGQSPLPMACSPCPSPGPSSAHNIMMSLSSPSRSPLPPQTYSNLSSNYYGYKGGSNKGMSPVHRVLMNSPNNQYMQIESLSALPPLEFLDDLDKDDVGIASSQDCFDLSTVPELLECLTMPDSSRFCGSHLSTQQNSVHHDATSVSYQMSSSDTAQPLLQQLQQERQQEKHQMQQQQQQMQNLSSSTLMVPLSLGPEQEQDSGLRLVHLLLACAEAVAKEDYMLGRRYLHHLNRVVTPLGDSMQRVASCFAEALGARLAATLTAAAKPTTSATTASSASALAPKPFDPFPQNSLEILKIYQILYQACPYIKFAHFTANQAIFEAFEAEERVHVIDLDILQGYQWPAFMQALAARPGGAPFLRITGVGPSPESVRETGRCLTDLAHSLNIPFEFHPVGELLEDLKPHMFHRRVGEALAVNSVDRLHRVPPNSLGSLLGMIRDQAPNIVTIVEKEASHNGPYFLGRFLEALHFYSAIFDSLDATFPPDSAQRAKVEQYIFAPEIRNIVAHEGPERTARHERLERWRKIMEGKGFRGVPLSANAVTQSKILLGLYSCDGYRLTEDNGCLLLGWQDRAILAASAWRC